MREFPGKPGDVPKLSKVRLMQASTDAEKAWIREAEAVLGSREASMARYQGRANGEPGTRLNELYNAFVTARDAYTSK